VRPNCRVEDRGGTATRWGGRRRIVNGNAQDEKPGRATAPTRPESVNLTCNVAEGTRTALGPSRVESHDLTDF
jgi:hypothetical protein